MAVLTKGDLSTIPSNNKRAITKYKISRQGLMFKKCLSPSCTDVPLIITTFLIATSRHDTHTRTRTRTYTQSLLPLIFPTPPLFPSRFPPRPPLQSLGRPRFLLPRYCRCRSRDTCGRPLGTLGGRGLVPREGACCGQRRRGTERARSRVPAPTPITSTVSAGTVHQRTKKQQGNNNSNGR